MLTWRFRNKLDFFFLSKIRKSFFADASCSHGLDAVKHSVLVSKQITSTELSRLAALLSDHGFESSPHSCRGRMVLNELVLEQTASVAYNTGAPIQLLQTEEYLLASSALSLAAVALLVENN